MEPAGSDPQTSVDVSGSSLGFKRPGIGCFF